MQVAVGTTLRGVATSSFTAAGSDDVIDPQRRPLILAGDQLPFNRKAAAVIPCLDDLRLVGLAPDHWWRWGCSVEVDVEQPIAGSEAAVVRLENAAARARQAHAVDAGIANMQTPGRAVLIDNGKGGCLSDHYEKNGANHLFHSNEILPLLPVRSGSIQSRMRSIWIIYVSIGNGNVKR